MKYLTFTDVEALECERACWDQVAGDRAFFRYSWLMNWYHAMHAENDQLHVLVGIDDQETVSYTHLTLPTTPYV